MRREELTYTKERKDTNMLTSSAASTSSSRVVLFGVVISILASMVLVNGQIAEIDEETSNGYIDSLSEHTETISLNSLGITRLRPGIFKRFYRAKTLFLNFNYIKKLEVGVFEGLTAVTRVTIVSNDITILTRDILKDLPALENLDVSRNRINVIEYDTFFDNPVLEVFVAVLNNLASIPKELFERNNNLFVVFLQGNPWNCCSTKWIKDAVDRNEFELYDRDRVSCVSPFTTLTQLILDVDYESLMPTCQGLANCGLRPFKEGSISTCDGQTFNSTCSFKCQEPYTGSAEIITCPQEGSWTPFYNMKCHDSSVGESTISIPTPEAIINPGDSLPLSIVRTGSKNGVVIMPMEIVADKSVVKNIDFTVTFEDFPAPPEGLILVSESGLVITMEDDGREGDSAPTQLGLWAALNSQAWSHRHLGQVRLNKLIEDTDNSARRRDLVNRLARYYNEENLDVFTDEKERNLLKRLTSPVLWSRKGSHFRLRANDEEIISMLRRSLKDGYPNCLTVDTTSRPMNRIVVASPCDAKEINTLQRWKLPIGRAGFGPISLIDFPDSCVSAESSSTQRNVLVIRTCDGSALQRFRVVKGKDMNMLSFKHFVSFFNIRIHALRLAEVALQKTFTLVLGNPTVIGFGDYKSTLSEKHSITVTIPSIGNPSGVFGFHPHVIPVDLTSSLSVTLTITRTVLFSGAVSVSYETVAYTAIPEVDYEANSGSVNFDDGDNDPQKITINLLNGTSSNDTVKLFYVKLTEAIGSSAGVASVSEKFSTALVSITSNPRTTLLYGGLSGYDFDACELLKFVEEQVFDDLEQTITFTWVMRHLVDNPAQPHPFIESKELQVCFVDLIDTIMDTKYRDIINSALRKHNVASIVDVIEDFVDLLSKSLPCPSQESIHYERSFVKIEALHPANPDNIQFTSLSGDTTLRLLHDISNRTGLCPVLSFVTYSQPTFFVLPTRRDNYIVANEIVSVRFPEFDSESVLVNLTSPVVYSVPLMQAEEFLRKGYLMCSWYQLNSEPFSLFSGTTAENSKSTGNVFSTSGCTTSVAAGSNRVSCACSHLTNFAVVVDRGPILDPEPPPPYRKSSLVGPALVLVSVSVIVIVMAVVRKLRQDHSILLVTNCFVAILLTNLFFIAMLTASSPNILSSACFAIGLFGHYSFFAMTTWMTITSFYLHYEVTSSVLAEIRTFRYKRFLAIGWAGPVFAILIFIVVSFGAGLEKNSIYGDMYELDDLCFIVQRWPVIFGFIVPVCLCVALGLFFCYWSIKVLWFNEGHQTDAQKDRLSKERRDTRIFVFVYMFLCLSWIFAFLYIHFRIDSLLVLFILTDVISAVYITRFYLFDEKIANALRSTIQSEEKEKPEDRPEIDVRPVLNIQPQVNTKPPDTRPTVFIEDTARSHVSSKARSTASNYISDKSESYNVEECDSHDDSSDEELPNRSILSLSALSLVSRSSRGGYSNIQSKSNQSSPKLQRSNFDVSPKGSNRSSPRLQRLNVDESPTKSRMTSSMHSLNTNSHHSSPKSQQSSKSHSVRSSPSDNGRRFGIRSPASCKRNDE